MSERKALSPKLLRKASSLVKKEMASVGASLSQDLMFNLVETIKIHQGRVIRAIKMKALPDEINESYAKLAAICATGLVAIESFDIDIPEPKRLKKAALDSIAEKIEVRKDMHGPGAYINDHETLGWIAEDIFEAEEAVSGEQGADSLKNELLDVAVTCIWGCASNLNRDSDIVVQNMVHESETDKFQMESKRAEIEKLIDLLLLPLKGESKGTCLYISVTVEAAFNRFYPKLKTKIVGGGNGDGGILSPQGKLEGHYWLEIFDGSKTFILDPTADQFNYKRVLLVEKSKDLIHFNGNQHEIDCHANDIRKDLRFV